MVQKFIRVAVISNLFAYNFLFMLKKQTINVIILAILFSGSLKWINLSKRYILQVSIVSHFQR